MYRLAFKKFYKWHLKKFWDGYEAQPSCSFACFSSLLKIWTWTRLKTLLSLWIGIQEVRAMNRKTKLNWQICWQIWQAFAIITSWMFAFTVCADISVFSSPALFLSFPSSLFFLRFFFLFYFASSHVGVITILQERPRACQERSVRGEAVHGIVLEEAGDFNSHPQLRWKACVFIIKGHDIYGNRWST